MYRRNISKSQGNLRKGQRNLSKGHGKGNRIRPRQSTQLPKMRRKIKVVFVCHEGFFTSGTAYTAFIELLREKNLFRRFSVGIAGNLLPGFEEKLRSADFVVPVLPTVVDACRKSKGKESTLIDLSHIGKIFDPQQYEPLLQQIMKKKKIS